MLLPEMVVPEYRSTNAMRWNRTAECCMPSVEREQQAGKSLEVYHRRPDSATSASMGVFSHRIGWGLYL
jgi:hypothetical protein